MLHTMLYNSESQTELVEGLIIASFCNARFAHTVEPVLQPEVGVAAKIFGSANLYGTTL